MGVFLASEAIFRRASLLRWHTCPHSSKFQSLGTSIARTLKKVKKGHLLNFRKPAFQQYAKALGELSLAWNDLHEMLGNLFWVSLGIPNGVMPLDVWHSSNSDRAQRDMLKAIAESHAIGGDLTKTAKIEILWVLKRAISLEDTRNNALHSPVFQSGNDPVEAAHQSGHRRAKQLANKDLLKELNYFYKTTMVLRDYSFEMFASIQTQNSIFPIAWPDRPKMPSRGDSNDK